MAFEFAEAAPDLTVGVVGCGAIGSSICFALDEGQIAADLVAVCDHDHSRAERIVWGLKRGVRSMTLPGLVSSAQLIVEATNPQSAPTILEQALAGGRDILLTNPVALLGRQDIVQTAAARKIGIHIPSGLVPGIDSLRLGTDEQVTKIELFICVPASAVPASAQQESKGPERIFSGGPEQAVKALPMLGNMVATAVLVGKGTRDASVSVIADPLAEAVSVEVQADIGGPRFTGRWDFPGTDLRAVCDTFMARSAIATLKRIASALKFG
jgi:aspartate dehydrogenase